MSHFYSELINSWAFLCSTKLFSQNLKICISIKKILTESVDVLDMLGTSLKMLLLQIKYMHMQLNVNLKIPVVNMLNTCTTLKWSLHSVIIFKLGLIETFFMALNPILIPIIKKTDWRKSLEKKHLKQNRKLAKQAIN